MFEEIEFRSEKPTTATDSPQLNLVGLLRPEAATGKPRDTASNTTDWRGG